MFNAEEYWAGKEYKKWVVFVSKYKGYSKLIASDKVIVRARTYEAACKSGRANSKLKGRVQVVARLATPADLGIFKTED